MKDKADVMMPAAWKRLGGGGLAGRKFNWPLLVAGLTPLVVLGPLLSRGYVLTYDMVFSPHAHIALQSIREGRGLYSALPMQTLTLLLNQLLPGDVIQKLYLYAIFFAAIYTMYRCLPLASRSARLTAGLMYALNPFTYDRLMAGHWLFLLAPS